MKINYVNLTNGMEALPVLKDGYRFIRIQSTLCEQKLWNQLIQELDYDFLFNIAIGREVVIYDYGAKKPISRALYQGVEFIKYVLNKRWLGIEYESDVSRTYKEHIRKDCNSYFESCYKSLDRKTKRKLDYFKPYVMTNAISIETVSSATVHDGDKEFYRAILRSVG